MFGRGRQHDLPEEAGYGPNPTLPPPRPDWLPTVKVAKAVGFPPGATPTAAPGLKVVAFARDLEHPRWPYVLPNGDVLVAESNAPEKPKEYQGSGVKQFARNLVMRHVGAGVKSPDRIMLLRDADGDGVAETRSVFLYRLHSPFGMTLVGHDLYVANADALVRFRYDEGATRITAATEKVVDLPGGRNHHWTKSLVPSPDGSRLYVGVGSNSNVGENGLDEEIDRAAILEILPHTGAKRPYATGLRNPVGMDWNPWTGDLWTAVNERDEIGDDLVPDYMTSVKDGAHYGWPWSYYGDHVDDRVKPPRPDRVAKALRPDYALGSHTASLGLCFDGTATLGPGFAEGAFIAQHGSWNRSRRAGYRVIFVPFRQGKPAGAPKEVLSGFLGPGDVARGRPVGTVLDGRGGLLVTDDVGNAVWRVTRA